MTVAIICTALLGLLVFGLGLLVSAGRGSANTVYGQKEDPSDTLYQRVRAHGNSIEYAPMLAVLMIYLGSQGPAAWIVWTFSIVTFARYLIVAGILIPETMEKPNPMRFIGALVTYLGGFALVIATVMTAF